MAWLFVIIHFGSFSGSAAYGMPRIAAEFSAGVLLHRLWEINGRPESAAMDGLSLVVLVVLVLGSNLAGLLWGTYAPLAMGPVLACVLVYGLACSNGALARALSAKGALFAGAISYSFYMVHGTVIVCARSLLSDRGVLHNAPAVLLAVIFSFAVSIVIARWMYLSIEQPARARMLTWRGAQGGKKLACSTGC
jgi:peptidoglycan/LPS O-acetylase OafA/YrhL